MLLQLEWMTYYLPWFFYIYKNTSNGVLSVLPNSQPLWWSIKWFWWFFLLKNYIFNILFYLKYHRQHNKLIHGLKNRLKTKNFTKILYAFLVCFKINKPLMWASLVKKIIWHQFYLFWKSVLMKIYFLLCGIPVTFSHLSYI